MLSMRSVLARICRRSVGLGMSTWHAATEYLMCSILHIPSGVAQDDVLCGLSQDAILCHPSEPKTRCLLVPPLGSDRTDNSMRSRWRLRPHPFIGGLLFYGC